MRYLELCAVMNERVPYIREWLDYHVIIGVEHFTLYDDGNTPHLAVSLADYVQDGLVEVIRPERRMSQLSAYAECLHKARGRCKWLAFIDVDEFVVPKDTDDLRILLTDYERHAGLVGSWLVFGSSGHVSRPQGLQMENYLYRLPNNNRYNCSIKSIVQPAQTVKALSPHNFAYVEGAGAVNEEEFPVSSPFSYNTVERLQINHYYYRSQQDWEEKAHRGEMWVSLKQKPGLKYTMDKFMWQLRHATQRDEEILRFAQRVRKAGQNSGTAFVQAFNQRRLQRSLREYLQTTLTLLSAGDLASAESLLGMAATRYPNDALLWRVRAQVHAEAGDTQKALIAIKRSIQMQQTPEAFYDLVAIGLRLGDVKMAHNAAVYIENRMQSEWSYFQIWDDRIDKAKKLYNKNPVQAA